MSFEFGPFLLSFSNNIPYDKRMSAGYHTRIYADLTIILRRDSREQGKQEYRAKKDMSCFTASVQDRRHKV